MWGSAEWRILEWLDSGPNSCEGHYSIPFQNPHSADPTYTTTSSSLRKHYDNDHAGAVPEDLLSCFKVLKKCMNKFDCLVNEMLYIKQLTPSLNVQTDSIRAKVLV